MSVHSQDWNTIFIYADERAIPIVLMVRWLEGSHECCRSASNGPREIFRRRETVLRILPAWWLQTTCCNPLNNPPSFTWLRLRSSALKVQRSEKKKKSKGVPRKKEGEKEIQSKWRVDYFHRRLGWKCMFPVFTSISRPKRHKSYRRTFGSGWSGGLLWAHWEFYRANGIHYPTVKAPSPRFIFSLILSDLVHGDVLYWRKRAN